MDEKGLEQYDVLDCLRVAIETKGEQWGGV
jgi:hypothetical protein